MYKFNTQIDIAFNQKKLPDFYDVAFSMKPVDERGKHSCKIIANSAKKVQEVFYDNESLSISISEESVCLKDLKNFDGFDCFDTFLFDSTTLSFAEILILLRKVVGLKKDCKIGFIYSQPCRYEKAYADPQDTHSFSLSNQINQVDYIPGFNSLSQQGSNVFLLAFVGFEDTRLSRALNPDEGSSYSDFSPVLCVPPFITGWENHSLMNHVKLFQEFTPYEVHFTSAFSFVTSYNKVLSIKQSLSTETFVIAPFGPKPTSVGVALCVAENEDISVIYDFPSQAEGRSCGVGATHYMNVLLEH